MRPDLDAIRAQETGGIADAVVLRALHELGYDADDVFTWQLIRNVLISARSDVPVLLDYIRELEEALRAAVTLGEAASSRGLSDYGMTVDAFAEELAAWTRLRAVLGVRP